MEDTEKLIDAGAVDSASMKTDGSKKKAPKTKDRTATVGETFAFSFETGGKAKISFLLGFLFAFLNGLVRQDRVLISNLISLMLLSFTNTACSSFGLGL